jgi:hypothetical protein
MKKGFWNKKIPTLLGLFLIVIGIGITSYFVQQGIFFITKAGPTDNPQEVRITNLSDSSATISFTTNGEAIGSINIGETKDALKKVLDDKDQASGKVDPRKIHNFTARNLKASTRYYFSITSGEDTYLNNDAYYELKTGTEINNDPSSQEPITGKILTSEGKAPSEAIIYATINNAQLISTVVKNDGTYILPLNSLRTSDLSSYFVFNENQRIKMTITGNGSTSNILLSIKQINPVPLITLSKNYDFTVGLEPEASASASLEKLPSFPATQVSESKANSPSIVTPKKDQGFQDQQPEFKGKALPNETVSIVIHSAENIKTEVIADKYGNWSYRPEQELSPGEHTISITTRDIQGILRTITQSFTVYASGSMFVNPASPTPTGIITSTPTIIPSSTTSTTKGTTTTTTVPSTTITIAPASTTTTTLITETPTPTQIILQTTTTILTRPSSAPPQSPGSSSLLNLGFIGITTIILGIVLLLLSRGSISFL